MAAEDGGAAAATLLGIVDGAQARGSIGRQGGELAGRSLDWQSEDAKLAGGTPESLGGMQLRLEARVLDWQSDDAKLAGGLSGFDCRGGRGVGALGDAGRPAVALEAPVEERMRAALDDSAVSRGGCGSVAGCLLEPALACPRSPGAAAHLARAALPASPAPRPPAPCLPSPPLLPSSAPAVLLASPAAAARCAAAPCDCGAEKQILSPCGPAGERGCDGPLDCLSAGKLAGYAPPAGGSSGERWYDDPLDCLSAGKLAGCAAPSGGSSGGAGACAPAGCSPTVPFVAQSGLGGAPGDEVGHDGGSDGACLRGWGYSLRCVGSAEHAGS